ncbi:MAG: dihydrofolate reductase, partial [Prevotella sp.]|nr:dihydrofolate reductase [Prevotella sp.]
MDNQDFSYSDDRFADIQILRYRLNGFEQLTLQQKKLVYYLSEATLSGRDITFDQFGRYNLRVRKMLEQLYISYQGDRTSAEWLAIEEYLKRVWFSSGIYHHYGCEKFEPRFTETFLREALGDKASEYEDLFPVIFDATLLPKRVDKTEGKDVIRTSACNFYDGVSEEEV